MSSLFTKTSAPTEQHETPDLDIPDDIAELGATPEAPYGYKADGTPYKRRPNGAGSGLKAGSGSSGRRMPASETAARTAASLLARLNSLVAIGFMAAQMPGTAAAMDAGNKDFEELAYQALLTDPALCKRILGAGATSGKAGLVMAYGMLGVSIFPAARAEIKEKREANESD